MKIKELIQALEAADDEEKKQLVRALEPYWEENAKNITNYANMVSGMCMNHYPPYIQSSCKIQSWLHQSEHIKKMVRNATQSI